MSKDKKIIFYCNSCSYKKITLDVGDFKEHFIPLVPTLYDRKKRKIDSKKRRKQFKCPKCGYVIIPKFISEVTSNDVNISYDDIKGEDDDECGE